VSITARPRAEAPAAVGPLGAVSRALLGVVRLRGRASRSEYWWFALVLGVVGLVAAWVDMTQDTGGSVLVVVWYAALLPTVTLTVRRLHDTGNSGYWIFVALMPVIGTFWILSMLIQPSDPYANSWGPGPPDGVRETDDPAGPAD
jgi:uncharacterized membrane protein YhaH (DUF805 family)